MIFERALQMIWNGGVVKRTTWKNQFIFLRPNKDHYVERGEHLSTIIPVGTAVVLAQHIVIYTPDMVLTPWLPSQADLIANDWEAVEQPNDNKRDFE